MKMYVDKMYDTLSLQNAYLKNVYHRCLRRISHQVTMAEKQKLIWYFGLVYDTWLKTSLAMEM